VPLSKTDSFFHYFFPPALPPFVLHLIYVPQDYTLNEAFFFSLGPYSYFLRIHPFPWLLPPNPRFSVVFFPTRWKIGLLSHGILFPRICCPLYKVNTSFFFTYLCFMTSLPPSYPGSPCFLFVRDILLSTHPSFSGSDGPLFQKFLLLGWIPAPFFFFLRNWSSSLFPEKFTNPGPLRGSKFYLFNSLCQQRETLQSFRRPSRQFSTIKSLFKLPTKFGFFFMIVSASLFVVVETAFSSIFPLPTLPFSLDRILFLPPLLLFLPNFPEKLFV